MNAENIIPGAPRSMWETVRELALRSKGNGASWLKFKTQVREDGRLGTAFEIDYEAFTGAAGAMLRNRPEFQNGLFLCWLEALGEMVVDGVKLFRPSAEQCSAMEQVEINIPIRDYRQPYPAMVIEFPREYRESLTARTGRKDVPRFVIVRHHEQQAAFFSGCSFERHSPNSPGHAPELTYFFQDRPEFATVEDALNTHVCQTDAESVISESMTRVAMNLCLLLTQYPTRTGPSSPDTYRKAVDRRDAPGAKGEANRFEAANHVHVVSLQQDIIVRETRSSPGPHEPTGRQMPPHWRKGHWRRQRYGAGREQVKTVFIRPVFVRSDAFTGDRSASEVVYRDPSLNKS